jgi:hypothetical protein
MQSGADDFRILPLSFIHCAIVNICCRSASGLVALGCGGGPGGVMKGGSPIAGRTSGGTANPPNDTGTSAKDSPRCCANSGVASPVGSVVFAGPLPQ